MPFGAYTRLRFTCPFTFDYVTIVTTCVPVYVLPFYVWAVPVLHRTVVIFVHTFVRVLFDFFGYVCLRFTPHTCTASDSAHLFTLNTHSPLPRCSYTTPPLVLFTWLLFLFTTAIADFYLTSTADFTLPDYAHLRFTYTLILICYFVPNLRLPLLVVIVTEFVYHSLPRCSSIHVVVDVPFTFGLLLPTFDSVITLRRSLSLLLPVMVFDFFVR